MACVASGRDLDDDEPRLLQSLRGETGNPFSTCRVVPGSTSGGHAQILTGSSSGAVFIWPLAPTRPPRPHRLGGHRGAITCVTCSRAGGLLASASADASIMLWKNQAMRQTPAVLRLHFSPVRSVDISSDEQLLLSGSDDKLLKLAAVANRRFVASFVGHSNWVRSAKFSPDASLAASGSDDKTVRLWDIERHALVRTWHDQSHPVRHVDFDPKGRAIVACSEDSVINVFDVRSKELRQHYNRAHGSSPVTQVAFHPTQDLLLSSSIDHTLRIWDLRAGCLRYTIDGHRRAVHSCSWEQSGGRFISCDDELVHIWSLPVASTIDTCEGPKEPVNLQNAEFSNTPASPTKAIERENFQARPLPEELAFVPPAGKSAFIPEFIPARPDPPVISEEEWMLSNFRENAVLNAECTAARSDPPLTLLEPTAIKISEEENQMLASSRDKPDVAEIVANAVEKMVTQMDLLTRSLQSLEARLIYTENAVSDLSSLMSARRASSS